ncbi:MAG: hypothetical protein A3F72_19510 [Bacteroidetes bacterium RIFCSPLOWO2_12_FULL_35_15]|nr:MAG: hypothetical protein A3F72_19510 [Bacteroidetes bacterium RIFCSPLOWO2_12_FULL_35_15]
MRRSKYHLFRALLVLAIITGNNFHLKSQAYATKQSFITAGYGFPSLYYSDVKNALEGYKKDYQTNSSRFTYDLKGYGPILLKYEYALTSIVGIGASFGYWNINYTQNFYYHPSGIGQEAITNYRYSSFSAGARLNFHFGTKDKLDPYAGIAGGFTKNTEKITYITGNIGPKCIFDNPSIYFALTGGLKYYFTKNIGAYCELGYDKGAVLQAGLAFKF